MFSGEAFILNHNAVGREKVKFKSPRPNRSTRVLHLHFKWLFLQGESCHYHLQKNPHSTQFTNFSPCFKQLGAWRNWKL